MNLNRAVELHELEAQVSNLEARPRAASQDGTIEALLDTAGDYGDEWCIVRNFGTAEDGDWRDVEWRPYHHGETAESVLAEYLADPMSQIYGPVS
jgi:hypothetical protein